MEALEAKSRTRTHAIAKIIVRDSHSSLFDQGSGPALAVLSLNETFTGDLDGESEVRALQTKFGDGSARMVSVQRFRGRLGGRDGSFVLQGSEDIDQGRIKASWFVVPGSGTGELAGVRGEGGFEGDFGQGSTGTLDYWFE
jgi:hypothetical protein